jgi:hypothetical protein
LGLERSCCISSSSLLSPAAQAVSVTKTPVLILFPRLEKGNACLKHGTKHRSVSQTL